MPYIHFKNGSINYLIKTSSESTKNTIGLIFIHGSGEHSFVWTQQLKNIEATMPLISIDLPSHGKSSKSESLSLNLYVEAVKEIKNQLKLAKVILCGHSLGGAISQTYYFKYPTDVAGLILMSTGAKLRVLPEILENAKNNFNEFLKTIDVGSFYRKTLSTIITQYVKQISKIEPWVVHRDFQICHNFNVMDKVDSINVPCLIIVGKADKLTPVKYHTYFHAHIKNSELHIIDGAGHAVMIEKPSQVNEALSKFLQKFK